MKKCLVFTLSLILSVSGVYTAGCSSKNKSTGTEKTVAEILPESAEFVIRLPSIEKIRTLFSVTENSVLGRPVEKIGDLKQKWGFNPLLPEELRDHGFDTGREMALAADNIRWPGNGGDPLMELLLLVPVTDGKKALASLRQYIQNEKPEILFSTEGSITYFKEAGKTFRGAVTEKEGCLLIAFNEEAEVKDYVTRVLTSEKPLRNAKNYEDVIGHLDTEKDIFIYSNIAKIIKNNYETLKTLSEEKGGDTPGFSQNLEYLKDYEGWGLSIDAAQSDLHVRGLLNVRKGSDFIKISQNARFNKKTVLGIPKNAALLISTAMDFQEYYRIIKAAMSDKEKAALEDRLADFRSRYGADAEKDFFSNIEGNLNIGIYDGRSINMTNYNLLATLSLKDGDKMSAFLDQVYQSLSPEQQIMIRKENMEGNDAYVMTLLGIIQIYAGVKDRNLIVAVGYPVFEMALNGDISTGFLSRMKDEERVKKIKGDTGLLYADIQELYKTAENFSFLMQQFNSGQGADSKSADAIRQLQYLLISNRTEENRFFLDLTFKTTFSEPFFQGLRKISEQMETSDPPPASD